MKLITKLLLLIVVCLSTEVNAQSNNPNYNDSLASKLHADNYGMKMYVFVILKTGDNDTSDKSFIDICFSGHLKNISRLAADGQLIVSGPFGENKDNFRGLFILNTSSMEEAKILLQTDPAINNRLLKVEMYPWYGSAALSEYLPFHDKIWKTGF